MSESGNKLSLRQLYVRIQVYKGKVREDYYDIGEEFKERLKEGLRKYPRRSYKVEKDVREKLYDEINAVKIYELFGEIGKDKMMKTIWNCRTIERCNKQDMIEVVKYFKDLNNKEQGC
ncbi:4545_t:CDS:2 [Rhizophagus irregularis]|nr:4545_t:CDS:2 [Rhizophagus irregularis]